MAIGITQEIYPATLLEVCTKITHWISSGISVGLQSVIFRGIPGISPEIVTGISPILSSRASCTNRFCCSLLSSVDFRCYNLREGWVSVGIL